MNNKKIIFVINGMGLGNSSRCESLIEKFYHQGYDIDVFTYGNGLFFFKDFPLIRNIFKLRALVYEKNKRGEISLLLTILNMHKILYTLYKNAKSIEEKVHDNDYSYIFINSDYSLIFNFFKLSTPIISINNSYDVITNNFFRPTHFKMFLQYITEKLDFVVNKLISKVILCPTFSKKMEPQISDKVILVPLITQALRDPKKDDQGQIQNITILSSGSSYQNQINIEQLTQIKNITFHLFGDFDEVISDNIIYYGKSKNRLDTMKKSQLIIMNAGLSSISEGVALQVPLIVIPLKNHYEQYVNARNIENLGIGIVSQGNNLIKSIFDISNNYKLYQDQIKKLNIQTHGSDKIANLLSNELRGY